ncbi:MAG TPA: cbb3-type cytochrome oxidase assembly protein CcoS [Pricia sp.]|uniref:Cbb3-type cytochrome oxidase assembly protein CcoS n=1 Tax=Pricia antarctica TaxID=641691 RepID=A0A831QV70_9FLAO|nr:cbb3-type cytochrome oxidase assembly protein CcoS [Pricia sp.]HEA23744.1 cbb3-type cytochrome oxidase assembly protein CcoS [Pricia antarctica]
MGAIYILLAVSIAIAVLFFIAFIVSVSSGQYDDSYTPSVRMLFDNELVKPTSERKFAPAKKDKRTITNQPSKKKKEENGKQRS